MTRHLIVANQTLGGAELEREITSRVERGNAQFHVLVPMIEAKLESSAWAPTDPMFGASMPSAAGGSDAVEQARRRSGHRLKAMIGRIEKLGGKADGEVGDSDPYKAVSDLIGRESFDEIIISTLPAGVSRWVKMDLPSRVDRLADCPVMTVEAEPTRK